MAGKARNGRAAILDSATRLFTKVGYHGTSIRDIASDASLTVPSIYYHFASKQEILQQIMVGILEEVHAETIEALEKADDTATARLEALVRLWILFHIRRQSPATVGASEIRSLDEEGLTKIVDLRDRQERLFRTVVADGIESGEFETPHPLEAARAIINMGRSIVSWYRPNGRTGADELADQYAELALAMVRARPSQD
ncbi:TetR/AcrR family transcriptional regulator [Aeromicrobium alkaliterrae]|uniref:TetR/AcrR family transcriptional regulator n=1 Tax=Aeromicrobium alkaliterrae TaxID=302168 RepID=A0ABN2K009_9ACTN